MLIHQQHMNIKCKWSSHPLITWPNPTENVKGCWPGSFVDQNFSARLLFFPYPVQCTVTAWPRWGMAPLPARRIVLVKPIFQRLFMFMVFVCFATQCSIYQLISAEMKIFDLMRTPPREKIFPPFSSSLTQCRYDIRKPFGCLTHIMHQSTEQKATRTIT